MVKIKVSEGSYSVSIIFFIIVFTILASLLCSIYSQERFSGNFIFVLIFGIIAAALSIFILKYFVKQEYVSDMHIYDDKISLIYKCFNRYKRTVNIKKSDIKEIYISLTVSRHRRIPNHIYAVTNIQIFRYKSCSISFYSQTEGDNKRLNPKIFYLALELIKNSKLLPDLRFNIAGDEEKTIKELQEFLQDYSMLTQDES